MQAINSVTMAVTDLEAAALLVCQFQNKCPQKSLMRKQIL
jgi:hypothetical protein